MTEGRLLVVIGEAPVAAQAASIGALLRGAAQVRVFELLPDQIGTTTLELLSDFPAGTIDVFAAIGPSALNYARFDLWAKLRLSGYRCATLVHPRAIVDPTVSLGDNVLVGPGAVVEPGATVGRGSIIGAASVVGASCAIAPWCWLAAGVALGAGAKVGSHTVLGPGVHILDRAEFAGPGEISIAGAYRGVMAAGTFIAPEFPQSAARLIRQH